MGKFARKTPFQKRKKEEKTKTKLKVSHKTILPKGQNITNTAFKVKKIVVKSQLKERQEEVVSKSNLNVKELLSRLHHHNAPLRIGALTGLCEVVNAHHESVFNLHLPALIHAASNLILDKEADVRTEAVKLLTIILTKATETQLTPLFEIIIKYLACAMSHIDSSTRENSLTMLDTLILKSPRLTARHCQPVILPAFLDLISTKFCDSERKLTLQYNNKMTTNAWRIKVLSRLNALLKAIVNIQLESETVNGSKEYVKKLKWNDEKPIYASLYFRPHDSSKQLDLSATQFDKFKAQTDEAGEIQNYAKILVPLLLQIFIEVAPQKTKNQLAKQSLTNDAAILLKYVLDILLLLWQNFDSSNSSSYLKQWFCSTFTTSILGHLITGRFPYSLVSAIKEDNPAKIKKNKSLRGVSGTAVEFSKILSDQKCTDLNTSVCHMYLLLSKYSNDDQELQMIIRYVTNLLKTCHELERETVTKLLNCTDAIFSSELHSQKNKSDSVQLVKIIKQVYDECSRNSDSRHSFIVKKTFSYLYKIALNQKNDSLSNESEINDWLDSLPRLLTEKKISFETVNCISNIARCNKPVFTNSLDGYIETILDNLPSLEIVSERKSERAEGKKLVVNLLYYVQTWDEEFVKGLRKALENGYFTNLTNHVRDIMETKLSNI